MSDTFFCHTCQRHKDKAHQVNRPGKPALCAACQEIIQERVRAQIEIARQAG